MSRSLPIATQTASNYKANIDAMAAWNFGVYPQSTPDMTVNVAAGALNVDGVIVSQSIQATGTITAPTTNPRIDRVVIDRRTGTASVITGTEAASPSAPSVTPDKIPCAQIALATSTTSIDDTLITNEFPVVHGNPIYATAVLSPTANPTYDVGKICRITLNAQGDAVNFKIRVTYGNASTGAFVLFAEYNCAFQQTAALNNDPQGQVFCTALRNQGNDLIDVGSIKVIYAFAPTVSTIDVYLSADTSNDRGPYMVEFSSIEKYATATFQALSAQTPIAALSWDVTSTAAPGVIVYDAAITLDNDFTAGTGRFIVTKTTAGKKCELLLNNDITHSSNTVLNSTALIPSDYRPAGTAGTRVGINMTFEALCMVLSTGVIRMQYSSAITAYAGHPHTSWYVPD